MITLTEKEWVALKVVIEADHGKSIILLRHKMKDVLGCTYRYGEFIKFPERNVYLDFYDDAQETWFILKYQ